MATKTKNAKKKSLKSKSTTKTKKRIKRRHLENAPMRSLDNAMDDVEAVAWINRIRRLLLASSATKDDDINDDDDDDDDDNVRDTNDESETTEIIIPIQIMAEPKIDGLSLSLRYQLRDDDDDDDAATTGPSSSSSSSPLSGESVYDFVWGATRGDGTQGEDVSEAVQSAWMTNYHTTTTNDSDDNDIDDVDRFSIPQSITISSSVVDIDYPPPALLEIRGEVVLPQKAFDEFTRNVTTDMTNDSTTTTNSTSSSSTVVKTFSNARNAASGILLRSKEPTSEEEIERTRFLQSRLQFYAYDIVSSSSTSSSSSSSMDEQPSSWITEVVGENGNEMRDMLMKHGFHVPSPIVVESLDLSLQKEVNQTDIPNLLEYHRNLMTTRDESIEQNPKETPAQKRKANNKKQNSDFPYQIDGVVYKLSSFSNRQICGSSSRTPRWAIAHKFPPQCAVTRLIDVRVQVGRTGALTPVAILEPVDLGGAMVSRASLHNFHYARKILLPGAATMSASNDDGEEGEGEDSKLAMDGEAKDDSTVGVEKGVSVLVSRAGDVIPQVKKRVFMDEVVPVAEYFNEMISLEAPQKCPACGSPTSFEFVNMPAKKKKKAGAKTEKQGVPENESSSESASNNVNSDDEELNDEEAESGQVLRCSGPQLLCRPRAVNALVYAYSRAGLDVKGLSKSKLRQLMEEDVIRFPSDLFAALGNENGEGTFEDEEDILDKIADLAGWGATSSQNLAESVRTVASEGVPLSRYIYSLGIPLVGTQASQLVASKYNTVNSFLKALEEASLYEGTTMLDEEGQEPALQPFATLTGEDGSEKVKGIGPAAIASLIAFSKEEVLMEAAKDLAKALTVHNDIDPTNSHSARNETGGSSQKQSQFEGMTVVFTGTLPGMSRSVAQQTVKDLGAKSTPNTVSKSTSLVVEGDKGGKKARKARELGIRVMEVAEFIKLVSG